MGKGSQGGGKESGSDLKARQVINLHKLLILPVYLATLAYYGGFSNFSQQSYAPAAALLLASHGFYALAWVFKDIHFGDRQWKGPIPITTALFFFFVFPLALYYLPMFCLVSDQCPLGTFAQGDEPLLLGTAVLCYNYGMFFVFGGDLQKTLALNQPGKRKLTASIFFQYSRNPNYFGEVMIYLGYALYSTSYFFLLAFVTVWLGMFLPNMLKKEKSLSRYAAFDAWKQNTGFIFPSFALYTDLFKYAFTTPPDDRKAKST
jgi:protein-S-isoprenylcysteine O-methyltransferase Ste14